MNKRTARFGYFTEKHLEKIIPKGLYCYNKDGVCPFWDRLDGIPKQENGYCHLLEKGDWESEGTMLLWDQCKECEINLDAEDLYE